MGERTWTGKRRLLAGGCAAVLLLAGFFSGIGLRRLFPGKAEEVSVYSVEGLRDKKWSDAVAVPAAVEAGSLTVYYYDSRKPAAELFVAEGQAVEKGTPLLRYDCGILEEELAGVEQSLANQRIYLERLGGFIGTLKATKPRADGLGMGGNGAGVRAVAGNGAVMEARFVSSAAGSMASFPAEESLEGLLDAEGQPEPPVVYERIDKDSASCGGSGTAQDPYVYYLRKGGEVAPEVIAMLTLLGHCGRFVVVEDAGSFQTPLFVWTFDGEVYKKAIQEESSSGTETPEETEPTSEEETTPSEESTPEETTPSEESAPTGETTPEAGSTSGEEPSSEEGSTSEEESLPEEGDPSDEESADPAESPPDFDGPFDDGALDEALSGLESEPQGYTKEELERAIRERSLEYENLELAIRKNELQAEGLKKEIEENILVAEADGRVRETADPKEAARLGQPFLTLQTRSGSLISGRMNEELAAVLKPGDRVSVSARVREKEVSFEAVLQSVGREPEGAEEEGAPAGRTAGMLSAGGPALSYYSFAASPVKAAGIRAGDSVEVMVPRELFGWGGGDAESGAAASEGSLVLPDTLLSYEGAAAFVYVMDGGGYLEKRQVEIGRSFEGTETEILGGIDGEDYLAYPEDAAGMEGSRVRIVYGEEMEIKTEAEEE